MHRLRLSVLVSCLLGAGAGPSVAADDPALMLEVQTLVSDADALIKQNRYEEALSLLTRAYELNSQGENPLLARNILNSLASLSYSTNHLETASRHFEELVRLDEADGDLQGLSVSLFNLAHALASRGLFSEADRHFRRSLQLSLQLGDEAGAAYTLKAMGVNAQATGDLEMAGTLLRSALEKFAALRDEQQEAAVLRHLGDIALQRDAAAEAVDYYLQAAPVLARHTFNDALLRTYRGLSLAYEQQGKLDKALIAQRAYSDLMRFDLEQQSGEAAQRMQAQLETQRYADDNARLQAIRIQQELQLEENKQLLRLQILVHLLGTSMFCLVLYMLLRSRLNARRMHTLAVTDELTGLLNRRAILQRGQEEWLRAARFHHPFSCLMLDIDHFKAINDNCGHAAGDEVLKRIANVLGDLVRKTDHIGRLGGEEFLVLAPETDRTQAITLAERIRIGIQSAGIESIGERRISASIGIAGLHNEESLEQLIRHADKALYTAKDAGRNRCILYQERIERKEAAKASPSLGLEQVLA